MLYTKVSSFILLALASVASAQNPFTFTTLTSINAGKEFNITWEPSTGTTDPVNIILRQGNSNALSTVMTIASKIQNTGSYIWSVPASIPNGSGYAFEIVDTGNTNIVNYSNQFSIISSNTAAPASSGTASGSAASTATGASSGASVGATTVTASTTSAASPTASGASTASSGSSSKPTTLVTGSSNSSATSSKPGSSPQPTMVNLNGAEQSQAMSLFGAVVAIGAAVVAIF
ncbi:hypothetical protein DH86_00004290 [Scytalidium sp. 3C]|nr:hypothetical protein DH86_00004290 [Scytalidium sp. 3C]